MAVRVAGSHFAFILDQLGQIAMGLARTFRSAVLAILHDRANLCLILTLVPLVPTGCSRPENVTQNPQPHTTTRHVSTSPDPRYAQQLNPFDTHASNEPFVLIFTRVDCPISNRYAPLVNELTTKYANPTDGRPRVPFYLVYPNPTLNEERRAQHLTEYEYRAQALWDPDQIFVARAHASVTPEAALFDSRGTLRYHGQIDNQHVDYGTYRPEATMHPLVEAIEAVLTGNIPAVHYAPAVGCLISDLTALDGDAP
jgi:hypothetical protein